ncbi:MAG: dihydroorotase [Gemmatimonadetes bacterium]|nr:MAG: dihydroorotase [Gemmatimonadota bacterium]
MRTLLRFSHARDSRLKPRLGLCRESSPPVPLSLRERGNYLPCPLSGTERGSGGEDRQVPSREFTRAHWVRSLPIVLLSALACAHPTGSGTPTPAAGPYDVVIEGGRVVDGTGNPWFYGDVAITGDRIARITPPGLLRQASARRRIDAHGLVVAPGIIDIQAQSGSELLRGDSRVISMVTQGVTTMIMGEGETPAPANAQVMAMYRVDSAEERLFRTFVAPHGFASWLDAMARRGPSVNFGSFLGAATVRAYAKGQAEGPATPAELDTMRAVVRRAMEDGAFGVGSALIYPPGSYASTSELVEEAKAMAPYGGVYITHMRSEGDRLLEAVDEALTIGREGGVPVEIYHLKAAGVKNWPKARLVVAKIDSARAAGQDVAADQYAYTAGANGLSSCIPPDAHADGKLLERLGDAPTRAAISADMLRPDAAWENLCLSATPAGVEVVGFKVDSLKRYEGERLGQIAQAMGKPWPDVIMDLTLAEKDRLGQLLFIASDSNVAMQVRQPWMKFGTDAPGLDPDSMKGRMTHPRAYGNYPRILGRFVREQHLLTLEDAIRKMTWAVAERLSIRDRGMLHERMYADVLIFDPATIIDRATYEQPNQLSVGVRELFVNGVEVVREGVHTGAKPGMKVVGPGARGSGASLPE